MSGWCVTGLIKKGQESFLDKSYFLFIYPVILSLGLLIRVSLSQDLFQQIKDSYWISDQNIINRTFADHGIEIFIALCVLIFIVRVVVSELQQNKTPLLPSNSFDSKNRIFEMIKKYSILSVFYASRYIITYAILVTLFKLKNYESVSTGGQCQPKNTQENYNSNELSGLSKRSLKITCLPDEQWIPGSLNISGHYFFIVTLSLSLFYELKLLLHSTLDSIDRSFEEEDDGLGLSKKLKLSIVYVSSVTLLVTVLLLIWCGTLTVTAIFYHTIREKIMGLAFGYLAPVINYVVLLKYYDA